jgi:putative ABC transport system permease protein
MRLSGLLYFYRLRLRTRWVEELFALTGIAVGVALVFAAQVASTSLTGSVEQLVKGTFGRAEIQLIARAPNGFDARELKRIRSLQGVSVAAPLLEARANVVGPRGRRSLMLLGADPSLARLKGQVTRRYRAVQLPTERFIALPGPVARRIGVSIGEPLTLEIGATQRRVHLNAALEVDDIGTVTESPVALVPLRYAQKLTGLPNRVTRVLVQPSPGEGAAVRRELEAIAGRHLDVQPADFDVQLFRKAALPTNQSTALFAAVSALVGFLFAFNAMLLTLTDRRRLVAALQVDGYAPGAIFEILLFDALMLGVTASLLGLALGDQLSRHLFDAAPGYLSFAFAVGEQRIVQWQSVVTAVGGGIGAALLASLLPLFSLMRRPASLMLEEPRPTGFARWMLATGFACLAVSVGVLVLAPSVAILGSVALTAALMLMLPALIGVFLRGAELTLRRWNSAVPLISIGELRSMAARSMALAATGALAVFGTVAIQGARADLQRGLDRSAHDVNASADVWASPGGTPNMLATTPFRDDAGNALRGLPEVRAVDEYRSGFLDFHRRRVWVLAQPVDAPTLFPPSQLTAGTFELATQRLRAGRWAIVSEAIAAEHHLQIGDRFILPAPNPTAFRVGGLSTNIGWPPGAIAINADDYRTAWGTTDPSAYEVQLAPGVSAEHGRAAVERALGANSALKVETQAQREHRQRAASRQGLSRLTQLATLVLVAAVLAMAAATAGMVWQRRLRLASLKLDGFDDLTVWRALLLESGLLLGAGCLIGAAYGLLGEILLDRALRDVTGFPIVVSIGLQTAAISFVGVTAVAVGIAALPGYFAARIPPAAALQE